MRVRVRGEYRGREAHVFGAGRVALDEFVVDGEERREFSIPRMTTYAVVDLRSDPPTDVPASTSDRGADVAPS